MSILDFLPLLFLIGVIYFFWKQNQSTHAIKNGGNPTLVKCKDCGQAVSKNAKACPHCGATRKKTSWVAWAVVAFMLLVMFNIIGGVSHTTHTAPLPAVSTPTKPQIAKKNGTIDARENDLDEICQDWVRFKAKAYKYGREGNQEAAADARKGLADTNRWLLEYPEADVSRVCAIYDTDENMIKWMK